MPATLPATTAQAEEPPDEDTIDEADWLDGPAGDPPTDPPVPKTEPATTAGRQERRQAMTKRLFIWGDTDYGLAGNGQDFLRHYGNGLAVVVAEDADQASRALAVYLKNIGAPAIDVWNAPAEYAIEDAPLVMALHGTTSSGR